MDPEACFLAFCGCITDGERELAADAADEYRAWIDKGGFPAVDSDGARILRLDPDRGEYHVDDRGTFRVRGAFGR